nr:SCP1.217Ac, unknown, len: 381aa; flanked by inverted repeat at 217861-217881 and 219205-219225 (Score 56: 20/21 (95%) matches, 0 gaps) [Kibdelosporangium sp. MJ126-NF4]
MLTVSVSRVALPVHTHQNYGHTLLSTLMRPGTYAVDDELRRIAVAPGDTRDTVLVPHEDDGCLGLAGWRPNLACARCGAMVAARVDDCGRWQAVWFISDAVRRTPVDEPPRRTNWDTLAAEYESVPPVERGAWNPLWEAAAGAALAHLLAVSTGAPVTVPQGLLTRTFGHALARLLPHGPSARTVGLTGPGLPTPAADIALVPSHPLTGERWRPDSAMDTVPLAADVWLYLAHGGDGLPIPATGRLPDGVLRDDPLPSHPRSLFRPDPDVFVHTLGRLPEVDQPWLREIHDRVRTRPWADPF